MAAKANVLDSREWRVASAAEIKADYHRRQEAIRHAFTKLASMMAAAIADGVSGEEIRAEMLRRGISEYHVRMIEFLASGGRWWILASRRGLA